MAITASGLYVQNMLVDVYDPTQLAIDLSLTTHRFVLYNNTLAPNFDTDISYAATNEVSGTGWAAGGVLWSAAAAGAATVGPITNDISPTGTFRHDMLDVAVSGTTLTNAMAMVAYADALAGNNLLYLINFVTAVSTNAGTLGVQFAAGGVFTVDGTP